MWFKKFMDFFILWGLRNPVNYGIFVIIMFSGPIIFIMFCDEMIDFLKKIFEIFNSMPDQVDPVLPKKINEDLNYRKSAKMVQRLKDYTALDEKESQVVWGCLLIGYILLYFFFGPEK